MSDSILVNINRAEGVQADVLLVRFIGGSVAPVSLQFGVEAYQLVEMGTESVEQVPVLDSDGNVALDSDKNPKLTTTRKTITVTEIAPSPIARTTFTVEGNLWKSWGRDLDDDKFLVSLACGAMGVTRKLPKKKAAKKKSS
mgnify:CR=1 FL=1